MGYLGRAGRIAVKDLRLEWRTRQKISSMVFFALLLLVTLHFSFDFQGRSFEQVGVGVLWVCITFAGTVGLGHSFVQEREESCLVGLLLCPGDRSAVFLGKFLSNLAFVTLVEMVLLPLAAFLFNYDLLPVLPVLAGVTVLYTLGFVALGTLFAAIAALARRGDVLLSILLFPLLLPLVMASVRAAGLAVHGRGIAEIEVFLVFEACYDVIVLVGGLLFFEYAVEE
jgi:heme exporter protein B